MTASEGFEEFGVYILRHKDRSKWIAEAKGGNEVAKQCMWAASKWMTEMDAGYHSVCSCCDALLSDQNQVRAFIVFVPTHEDPDRVKAKTGGVCAGCSLHDDNWLVDRSVHSIGLAPIPSRRGNQVH
jgi:hypothetical protein